MLRTTIVMMAVLALGLAACDGPAAGADQDWVDFPDGKADGLTPQGDLGYLLVQHPALPAGASIAPYTLTYRSVVVTVGQRYRLAKGSGTLVLSTPTQLEPKEDTVVVEPKTTTTYVMPAVVVTWDPQVTAVDVGPIARAALTAQEATSPVHTLPLDSQTSSPRAFPLLAGTYTATVSPEALGAASVGGTGAKVLTLPRGRVESLRVTQDVRAAVTFRAPVREAGEPAGVKACAANGTGSGPLIDCQYGHHWVVWKSARAYPQYEPYYDPNVVSEVGRNGELAPTSLYGRQGIRSLFHFELPDNGAVTVRMYPLPATATVNQYMYVTNNVPYWFSPAAGASIIEGQHLDVFDAEVDDGGAVATYPATYGVEWRCPATTNREWCARPGSYLPVALVAPFSWGQQGGVVAPAFKFATPSGLDLPPGAYRITVKVTTDGGPLTRIYECDFVSQSVSGDGRCTLVSEQ
jgi:hypothetical protein